ncbi:3514_t:CDS:2, partial [Gigaspora margarita]
IYLNFVSNLGFVSNLEFVSNLKFVYNLGFVPNLEFVPNLGFVPNLEFESLKIANNSPNAYLIIVDTFKVGDELCQTHYNNLVAFERAQ